MHKLDSLFSYNKMGFQEIFSICFVTYCLIYGCEGAISCYSCDRISVTDYGGASESDVATATASVLSVANITNNADCTAGSLSQSEELACGDGEVCYVLLSTFTLDLNSDTITAEGEIHYCLNASIRLPDIEFGCEDESHAEFTAAADNSIGLLTSAGSPFTNDAGYDGQICKCTVDNCNTDAVNAAANLVGESADDETTTSAGTVKQIHTASLLAIGSVLITLLF